MERCGDGCVCREEHYLSSSRPSSRRRVPRRASFFYVIPRRLWAVLRLRRVPFAVIVRLRREAAVSAQHGLFSTLGVDHVATGRGLLLRGRRGTKYFLHRMSDALAVVVFRPVALPHIESILPGPWCAKDEGAFEASARIGVI